MKLPAVKKLLLPIIAALSISACSSSSPFTQQDLQDMLDSKWNQYSAGKENFEGGLAMQILSAKGDYFISTGMGDDMSASHKFRTASVTKTFTAAGIMLLSELGDLDIDNKITDKIPGKDDPYVPDSEEYDIPNKDQITIRMVLMHRAGIFDLSNQDITDNAQSHDKPYVNKNYLAFVEESEPEHQFTFDELFGVISENRQVGFEGAPGSQYKYSDTGYCLLALIIERVTGKSYEEFITEEFIVPNSLDDTTLPWRGDDTTLPDPFVKGLLWTDNQIQDVTISNMSPYVGNGNIITTPADLARWCEKLFTGTAGISLATVQTMMEGEPVREGSTSTYGLGILYSEDTGYGHGGAHPGYLTQMYYKPENGLYYVMVSNVWNCENCTDGSQSLEEELATIVEIGNDIFERMGF